MLTFRINGCMYWELKSWNNLIKFECIDLGWTLCGIKVSLKSVLKKDSRLQISIVEFVFICFASNLTSTNIVNTIKFKQPHSFIISRTVIQTAP